MVKKRYPETMKKDRKNFPANCNRLGLAFKIVTVG
jgi:hypothetical protein